MANKLKHCLILDHKLQDQQVDELELAKLGLKLKFVSELREAENIFELEQESIGLIISDITYSSKLTARFLRKVLHFNSYHRLEIPIILSNSEMGPSFEKRMVTKFSELINFSKEDNLFPKMRSSLLKGFLKYLRFLILRLINRPPIELNNEIKNECQDLLGNINDRLENKNQKDQSYFKEKLENIIQGMKKSGIEEEVDELNFVQKILDEEISKENLALLDQKNKEALTEEEVLMIKDSILTNVEQTQVVDEDPAKTEEEVLTEVEANLIQLIHIEIDQIDEHTFNIDDSEVREEVLSVLRSLKDQTKVNSYLVYDGLKDIESELRKVSEHIVIEDQMIRIIYLTRMKEIAESLMELVPLATQKSQKAVLKKMLRNIQNCLMPQGLDDIKEFSTQLQIVKSHFGQCKEFDKSMRMTDQLESIYSVVKKISDHMNKSEDNAEAIDFKRDYALRLLMYNENDNWDEHFKIIMIELKNLLNN